MKGIWRWSERISEGKWRWRGDRHSYFFYKKFCLYYGGEGKRARGGFKGRRERVREEADRNEYQKILLINAWDHLNTILAV